MQRARFASFVVVGAALVSCGPERAVVRWEDATETIRPEDEPGFGGPADDEEPIAVGGGRHGAAVADVDGIRRGGAAHGNDPTQTCALTAARREGIEARQIEGGAATVYRQRRNRCPREDSVHRDGSRTGEGEEEGPRVDIPLEGEGLAGAG